MIFDNPIFAGWYTDAADVYRVVNTTVGNVDTQERRQVGAAIPCRVYSSQKNGPAMQDTAARVQSTDKLSCDVRAAPRAGDGLLVTRGGALRRGGGPARYVAGDAPPV